MRRCRAASGYESVSATSPGVQTPPLAPAAHRRRAHASITSTNSTANHLRPRLACARSTTRRSPRRSEQPSTAAPPLSGLTYHPIHVGRMGMRHPGARARKDTYVSAALQAVRDPRRVEKQTGVALATLKTHYEKWMPDPARDELRQLGRAFGAGDVGPRGGPQKLPMWNPAGKFR